MTDGSGEPDGPLPRVRGMQPEQDEVAVVYARACGRLIGLLTVMGGSPADAEEIAQDAFVKLLEKWPTVRDYDDVDGWLRMVAVRMLVSRHRRRAVATAGLARLRARAEAVTRPGTEADRLDLAAALQTLPVTHRAALLLHHVHDLPVDEVARILRVPTGTVKSRLSRARSALAPLLGDSTESERSPS